MLWMVINGVIATMATIPKASVMILPSNAVQAPIIIGNKNEVVSGPDAAPPESNATAVKISGVK